jgi:uncharacterized repeat protein (TIGR04076 family)
MFAIVFSPSSLIGSQDSLCCERVAMRDRAYRLVITAKEIRGKCPVFTPGNRLVIDGPQILPQKTDAICVHALGSMLSMIVALSKGVSFKELGLAKEEGEVGYVQCLDPGPPTTSGGSVIFEITRAPKQMDEANAFMEN